MKVHFMTGKVCDDYFYGSCYEFNALFKMNLTSGELCFINSFNGQEKFQKALYRDSIMVDDIIYFLPDTAKGIAAFDVTNNKIEIFSLPPKERICTGYNGILLDEKKMLMIPLCFEEDFYFFDTNKKQFEIAEEITNTVKGMLDNLKECLCLKLIKNKNNIVLPIAGTDILIDITYQNGSFKLKKIRSEVIISSLIECQNGYMVVSGDGKSIVKYIEGMVSESKKITGDTNRYWAIQNDIEDNTILLDKVNKKLLVYTDSFNDFICENDSQIEWEYTAKSCFFRSADYNEAKLLYSINMNGIIVSQGNSNTFIKMKISNMEELEQYLNKSMKENIVAESDSFGLNDFLKLL